MNIDNITDADKLRLLLKTQMIKLKETIKTPTHIYKAGEYFFFTQDEDGLFLYENNPTLGIMLTYDEAAEVTDF